MAGDGEALGRLGLDLPARPLPALPRGGALVLGAWAPESVRPRLGVGEEWIDPFLSTLPREDPSGANPGWSGHRFLLSLRSPVPGDLPVVLTTGGGEPLECRGAIRFSTGARGLSPEPGRPRFAICMATYRPDLELFARQIRSIQEQQDQDWLCLLQDDGSRPEELAAMEEVLGDDPRFRLRVNAENLGFYENFEACLSRVPEEARFVVLCDQDDSWYPEKLTCLGEALENGAQLAFSDCRLVDRQGGVLSETFWTRKRNHWEDFPEQVLANTVSGSAAAFRRELLTWALPFPRLLLGTGARDKLYHDHWLALVAMARGHLAYLDRPLHDYVQHEGADTGHFDSPAARERRRAEGTRRRRERLAATVAGERSRLRLMLETLLLRGALEPGREQEARALLRADRGLGPQLVWFLSRLLSGRSLQGVGAKLWLRRGELRCREWLPGNW